MKHLFKLKAIFLLTILLITSINLHAQTSEYWCMKFYNDLTAIVVGQDGIIRQTTDGGASWVTKASGTTNTLKKTAAMTNDNTIVVGLNGTIIKTTDLGDTWSVKTSGTAADLNGVAFGGRDSQVGIAVGDNGVILRTTDQGESWTVVSDINSSIKKVKYTGVVLTSDTKGVIAGDKGVILLTTDGGLTWFKNPSDVPYVSYKFLSNLSASIIYATGENGVIIKTTDGGASWISLNTNTTSTLYRIRFADDQIATSVGTNGEILKTTDGGITWNQQTSGTANDFHCLTVIDENTAVTAGQNGTILKTTDGGASWFSSAGSSFSSLRAGKNDNVKLFPCYPNPSNPVATIKYYVANLSQVTLKIYNAAGSEVRTLVNQTQNSGLYSTLFDGTNLSSGTYYCRIIAESDAGVFRQSMKIVLIK